VTERPEKGVLRAVTRTGPVELAVEQAVAAVDVEQIRGQYWAQDEFVYLPGFLPASIVREHFLPQVERLRLWLHRNYLPGHKKGGSVSYFSIREQAREFVALYRSPALVDFLTKVTQAPLQLCPDTDPHACALYYYTEAGDYIGWDYDRSYYKGARYTILLGLIDRSEHCRLLAQLYKGDASRTPRDLTLILRPGDVVIFNGDKLWHAVSPLEEGGYRVVLTLEYVTNPDMHPVKRLVSNLKDAFAYFGLRTVFGKRP
jgi:hypothetical protein